MTSIFVKHTEAIKHTELDGKTFSEILEIAQKSVKDLTLDQLAFYNWGTKEPSEVNRALRETVGCESVDDGDPGKTKLDTKFGPGSDCKILIPKIWETSDLAQDKTHTIKIRKRAPAPAISITDHDKWFTPGSECEMQYSLEGVTARVDKVDFEVHATSYYTIKTTKTDEYENVKGEDVEDEDINIVEAPPHKTILKKEKIYEEKKPESTPRPPNDKQSYNGWKGEAEADDGVLKTGSNVNAACAPYTTMFRFYKNDSDKEAKITLDPFLPLWTPLDENCARKLVEKSLIVKWEIKNDNDKLTAGQLIIWDNNDKEVFRAVLNKARLKEGQYDLIKDSQDRFKESDIKEKEMPYRAQIQAHSDSEEKDGLAIAVMHALVRTSDYKEVQFIGFNIRPGYKGGGTTKQYLGDSDAQADIDERCDLMKEAIKEACQNTNVNKDSSTLKLFMAPEFYFRGQDGAYPIEKISYIVETMRQETDKIEYADWLFVFGTAIGYLPHEDKGKKNEYEGDWKHNAEIIDATDGTKIKVDFQEDKNIIENIIEDKANGIVWKVSQDDEDEITQCSKSDSIVKAQSKLFAKITIDKDAPWKLRQDATEGKISKSTVDTGDTYFLTVETDKNLDAKETIDIITPSIKEVTVSDADTIIINSKLCSQIIENGSDLSDSDWKVRQGDEDEIIIGIIIDCVKEEEEDKYRITLEPEKTLKEKPIELINTIAPESVLEINNDIYRLELKKGFKTGKANLLEPVAWVVEPTTSKTVKIKSRVCERIPSGISKNSGAFQWKIGKDASSATEITKCKKIDFGKISDVYELILKEPAEFDKEAVVLVEPITTEVFNIALVQKGWPTPSHRQGDLNSAVIYKEYASSMDFILSIGLGWKKRKIKIHGDDERVVLPVYGSRDLLKADPNAPGSGSTWKDKNGVEHTVGSEINKSGLGGGSVITVNGVTFGIEVCRDHFMNRLHTYYDGKNYTNKDDPKPQILLIPSWGMTIESGKVCCVDDGLILNVDGQRRDSVARIYNKDKYSCRYHPTAEYDKPGRCTEILDTFYCETCKETILFDICAEDSSHPVTKGYRCANVPDPNLPLAKCGKFFPEDGECLDCSTKKEDYVCPICKKVYPAAGKCTKWLFCFRKKLSLHWKCSNCDKYYPKGGKCKCDSCSPEIDDACKISEKCNTKLVELGPLLKIVDSIDISAKLNKNYFECIEPITIYEAQKIPAAEVVG